MKREREREKKEAKEEILKIYLKKTFNQNFHKILQCI